MCTHQAHPLKKFIFWVIFSIGPRVIFDRCAWWVQILGLAPKYAGWLGTPLKSILSTPQAPLLGFWPLWGSTKSLKNEQNLEILTFFGKIFQNFRFSSVHQNSRWVVYTTNFVEMKSLEAIWDIFRKILIQKNFWVKWAFLALWSKKWSFLGHFFQMCAWWVQHIPAAPDGRKWIGQPPRCPGILESCSRTQ